MNTTDDDAARAAVKRPLTPAEFGLAVILVLVSLTVWTGVLGAVHGTWCWWFVAALPWLLGILGAVLRE